MIIKILFTVFSFFFFVYMVWPMPAGISDFPSLPSSVKSTLEGDTTQVPNVAAYFSNNYRTFVTSFYEDFFWKANKFPFPPIKLNYPPEFAFTAIKDQTQSTYLEEYLYPLRSSVFVNGMEPLEDGNPRYPGAIPFEIGRKKYDTKVTLRYYPSPLIARIIVWVSLEAFFVCFYVLFKRIIKHG